MSVFLEYVLAFHGLFGTMVCSAALFGFGFTIKHASYYSVWARTSVLLGFLSSMMLAFVPTSTNLFVINHIWLYLFCGMFMQATIATFIYTIIRNKWSWSEDFRLELNCEYRKCPLVFRINSDKNTGEN